MDIYSRRLLFSNKDSSSIPKGEVVFEKANAGMYSVNIPEDGLYEIIAVGGGGGAGLMAIGGWQYTIAVASNGGSGAIVHGIFKVLKGTISVIVGALGKSASTASNGVAASVDGGYTSVGLLCKVGGGGRGLAGFQNPVVQQGGPAGKVISHDEAALMKTILIKDGNPGTFNRWWTGNRDGTVSVPIVNSPCPPYGAGSGGSATTRYRGAASFGFTNGTAGYVKIIYQGRG